MGQFIFPHDWILIQISKSFNNYNGGFVMLGVVEALPAIRSLLLYSPSTTFRVTADIEHSINFQWVSSFFHRIGF